MLRVQIGKRLLGWSKSTFLDRKLTLTNSLDQPLLILNCGQFFKCFRIHQNKFNLPVNSEPDWFLFAIYPVGKGL